MPNEIILILQSLITGGVAVWISDVWQPIRFKPFNCAKCMGFWLGLAFVVYQKEVITKGIIIEHFTFSIPDFAFPILSSIFAILIWKKLYQ